VFPQVVIALPSGHALTIAGDGAASDAPYVQAATWNGQAWDSAAAPPSALTAGGTLHFTLGAAPQRSWAAAPAAAPPSYGAAAPPG